MDYEAATNYYWIEKDKDSVKMGREELLSEIVEYKKIPVEALKKLPQPMNLIKIVPDVYDFLESDLKKKGFSSRQQLKCR